MSTKKNDPVTSNSTNTSLYDNATWGPWLFRVTLVGTLLFMWWLVIYDHGVVSHH